MAFLREHTVYQAANRARARRQKTMAKSVLLEQVDPRTQHYDIFLSHSVQDAELVLGAKQILEDLGHTVYVDWVEDPQLDRNSVNQKTAEVLRQRMKCCDSLFYLHSRHSQFSRWMPWELGFFDGHNGNVAVLPIVAISDNEFTGQEYLSLYPTIDIETVQGKDRQAVWVNRSPKQYMGFKSWKGGKRLWKSSN